MKIAMREASAYILRTSKPTGNMKLHLTASPASFPRTHFNQMNAVTPACNTGRNTFELCSHSINWHAPAFGQNSITAFKLKQPLLLPAYLHATRRVACCQTGKILHSMFKWLDEHALLLPKTTAFYSTCEFFQSGPSTGSALNFASQNSVISIIRAHHAENNSLPFCTPAFVKGFSNAATPDDQNPSLASICTVPWTAARTEHEQNALLDNRS